MFLFELSFLITAWLLSYIQLLERKFLVGSCRRISCRCVGEERTRLVLVTFLPPCSTSGWDSEKSISACPQVLCADSPFSKPSLPHPKPAQFLVPNPSTRGSAQHPRPCISRCRRKFGSWWWPKGAPLVPPNWDVPRRTPAVGGCSQLQGAAQMCSLSAPSAAQQPQLNMAPFSLVEKKPARVSRDFMNSPAPD